MLLSRIDAPIEFALDYNTKRVFRLFFFDEADRASITFANQMVNAYYPLALLIFVSSARRDRIFFLFIGKHTAGRDG